ncbi:hypothetical protein D3C81_1984640 [compost metagenome]
MKNKGAIVMPIGMLMVAAGILLDRYATGINDFVHGIVYGVGVALILFGLTRNRKKQAVK